MCIAHYIAKVVVEEEKKGRKPRPNKLYTPIEHKQANTMSWTLRCPALRTGTCTRTMEPFSQDVPKMRPPPQTHLAVPTTQFVYITTPEIRTPH